MIKKLILGSALCCSTALFAQNWTGAVDANWNNPANWSTPPATGGDVVINPTFFTGNAASPTISTASSFSPATILVTNGGDLVIQQNVTTSDNVEILGAGSSLTVTSGTLQVAGSGDGRLIVDLGATMLVSGGTVNVGQRLISGSNSLITIQNGTVYTEERLLMDLGGAFVQNGGVVNVGQTFAMADGEGAVSCSYTLNGGTLSITGEMAFENEAGNFQPTFTQTGGTLNVNGDVSWLGIAPGSGTPRMILQGGIAYVNGNVLNMPASTVSLFLHVRGTAELNLQNSTVTLLQATDSLVLSEQGIIRFNGTTATIANAGVIFASGGTIHQQATGLQANGAGFYQAHNLLINANSVWNQNQSPLRISGDLTKTGLLNTNQHALHWNGTAAQTISGTGELSLQYLILENTSTDYIDFLIPIRIQTEMNLNQGYLRSSTPSIRLIFNDNAIANNASTLSFVDSEIRKIGNDAFEFPAGKNGIYAPIAMTAPGAITQEVTAQYSATPYTNITSLHPSLSAVSPMGYWKLRRLTPEQLGVTLHWSNASQQGISNCADLTFAAWNGTVWQAQIATLSGACTGTSSGSISATPPQADSVYTFGFIGNVTAQNITLCAGTSLAVGTNVYTESGNYMDVLTDINGQDSTVLTYLTVLPVLETTESYSLCFGESITLNGQTVTEPGTYVTVYTSAFGCDSTITSLVSVQAPINTTVVISNGLLEAQATNASYQWYANCAVPVSLANEIQATFAPTTNGDYFVDITDANGCSATSDCVPVNFVGITETADELLYVSPNPSVSNFHISGLNTEAQRWTVSNALGQVVLSGVGTVIEMPLHPAGMYLLRMEGNQEIYTIPLVKE